jgi:hypothetical protein
MTQNDLCLEVFNLITLGKTLLLCKATQLQVQKLGFKGGDIIILSPTVSYECNQKMGIGLANHSSAKSTILSKVEWDSELQDCSEPLLC